jgi:hypothetical protein
MRKLLLESLIQFPLTEPAPAPDDADLAALAQGLARPRAGVWAAVSPSERWTPARAMAAN